MEEEHDALVGGTFSDAVLQMDWVEVREELGVKEVDEMDVFISEGDLK